MNDITLITRLKSGRDPLTEIWHAPEQSLQDLLLLSRADVAVISTEDGFSTLGLSREVLTSDLGVDEKEIRSLAEWNRCKNSEVSLVAIPSRKHDSKLRGVVLAPGQNTLSYSRFANPYSLKPHRDYYYNVAYEAFSFACKTWGAKKIALSHLCGSGRYHQDMATCQIEALSHFAADFLKNAPRSLTFFGCCIEKEHFCGLNIIGNDCQKFKHKPISVKIKYEKSALVLTLNWQT